jgi:hypothetical protein
MYVKRIPKWGLALAFPPTVLTQKLFKMFTMENWERRFWKKSIKVARKVIACLVKIDVSLKFMAKSHMNLPIIICD